MKPKKQDDTRQLKLDFRVRLEPALEQTVTGLSLDQVMIRARAHYRWAKQLYVLHRVMLADGIAQVPAPAERLHQDVRPDLN